MKRIFIKVISLIILINSYAVRSELRTSDPISEQPINKKSIKDQDITFSHYILGHGDQIFIKILNIPEYSGNYYINPDGYINLPEIDAVYAEGLSINNLEKIIKDKYKTYIYEPNVSINIITYRPVRVYIKGEVSIPGFYTLSESFTPIKKDIITDDTFNVSNTNSNQYFPILENKSSTSRVAPTIFDAISAARGITPYSDLEKVYVIRNTSKLDSSTKIKVKLNFLSLFLEGDQSQNIKLFDGDTILISKSNEIINDQLISQARKTNISPYKIMIFVSGNVESKGTLSIPQGSGLTQAIAMAGGKKVLSGNVEFLRFNKKGDLDKRVFPYDSGAEINTYKNPILMSGDIINIKQSALGYSTEVLGKVSRPVFTLYSILNIFDD